MSPTNQIDSEDRELRQVLKSLPQRRPSADLAMRLRILASRESARRQGRVTWRKAVWTCLTDFRVWADNLMRPLAIPTAGGFLSALLLFGVLAPQLATPIVIVAEDVPTALYTTASIQSFKPLGFNDVSILVEVTIDDEGRVVDYSIPNAQAKDQNLHRSIENYLLFTQFTPVRNFGQPVKAKVRISFQSSSIEVRG
jgi:hypothetical protein